MAGRINYLFTDLDHTILYSHRHLPPGPVVWVEQLHRKDQSWVTVQTYRYFKNQRFFRVVPVTTRTSGQLYRLSSIMEDLGWNHVLIGNGAVLLKRERAAVPADQKMVLKSGISLFGEDLQRDVRLQLGEDLQRKEDLQGDVRLQWKEDLQWREESVRYCGDDLDAWMRIRSKAGELFPEDSIVTMEPFLFYIKTAEPAAAARCLSAYADPGHLKIDTDARKVYCLPLKNSKGSAIQRYMKRFGPGRSVAAGDSDFDVSMLKSADTALYPPKLTELMESPDRITLENDRILCEGFFSDDICRELFRLESCCKRAGAIKPYDRGGGQ